MTRTFRPFQPFRPIARALLAAGALLAAAAASAAPVVFNYTGVGTDGSAITGTFGWDSNAVPYYTVPGGYSTTYYETPATPVGGFLTGTVSGGVYDGAVVSYVLNSWGVIDVTPGNGLDSIVATSTPYGIMLSNSTGTALNGAVPALPDTLDLADWDFEHRGRFSWGTYEQLDFTLTSISLASATVPATVPEPGSLALAGLAATAGAVVRRKRRAAGESAGAASPSPRAGT